MSKKALINNVFKEIIGLFDSVENILWCQNDLRTQGNSLILSLAIGKGWK